MIKAKSPKFWNIDEIEAYDDWKEVVKWVCFVKF